MTLRLLVLVIWHRLWGNPSHLSYLSTSLAEAYPELHILVTKSNANSFTYDGIDLGGERITNEIEEKISTLEEGGCVIRKISLIGYSLGGLVARYAIGLLYSRGCFDKIEPVVRPPSAKLPPKHNAHCPSELHHFCEPSSGRADALAGPSVLSVERLGCADLE